MPTFTNRWSVDWDTVLAGISYDGDGAPTEVDYFSCKTIQGSPSATSFEVMVTPMSQGIVRLQAPPVQSHLRPSRIPSPNKATRRNAGFFNVSRLRRVESPPFAEQC